jgi:hypothetical protein
MQLHFTGLADVNFKFTLSHNFKQVSGCGTGWIPPGVCLGAETPWHSQPLGSPPEWK